MTSQTPQDSPSAESSPSCADNHGASPEPTAGTLGGIVSKATCESSGDHSGIPASSELEAQVAALAKYVGMLRAEMGKAARQSRRTITGLQSELRRLRCDIAVLRDSPASVEMATVEPEVVIRALPPEVPGRSLGVVVASISSTESATVNCAERISICRAACCRLYNVALTASEVRSRLYQWDVERPYYLRRTGDGSCCNLQRHSRHCGVYQGRPAVCKSYSCAADRRIWLDFDGKVLQADTAALLDQMDSHASRDEALPDGAGGGNATANSQLGQVVPTSPQACSN